MTPVSNAAALRGFKATVTQKLNKAEKCGATVNAAANPTSRVLEDLQASIDDIEAQAVRFNEFFQHGLMSKRC
jgi:lipid II:glycine glycyltransferase (peptidoglycan interpeptide bridge formation enzyme)